jgi:hypothetical protein
MSPIMMKSQGLKFNSIQDNLLVGGNFGISMGSYTYIQIAPTVHYQATDELILGLGLDYTYFNDKTYQGFSYHGSIWGPRVFARYFVFDDIFLHAEYQQIYYKDVYNQYNFLEYISESKFYGGVGYRTWFGENSYGFMTLLFDLQSSDFVFGINPFLQIGFAVGI